MTGASSGRERWSGATVAVAVIRAHRPTAPGRHRRELTGSDHAALFRRVAVAGVVDPDVVRWAGSVITTSSPAFSPLVIWTIPAEVIPT